MSSERNIKKEGQSTNEKSVENLPAADELINKNNNDRYIDAIDENKPPAIKAKYDM